MNFQGCLFCFVFRQDFSHSEVQNSVSACSDFIPPKGLPNKGPSPGLVAQLCSPTRRNIH